MADSRTLFLWKIGLDSKAKGYQQKIASLQQQISVYSSMLSNVDEVQSQIVAAEKEISDYSEQMLLGVAAQFGKNSYEYEKAGGVRKSERKHPHLYPPIRDLSLANALLFQPTRYNRRLAKE